MARKKLPRVQRARLLPTIMLGAVIAFAITGLVLTNREPVAANVTTKTPVTDDKLVLVPVPTRPVAQGEAVKDIPVTTVRWPASQLQGEYIFDTAAYKSYFTRESLPVSLPIPVRAVTAQALEANVVADRIPEGMRAITIRVDVESGVEGWARSGSSVDVILIRTDAANSRALESSVIAENVQILSAGSSAAPGDASTSVSRPPATVTLLVSQENALKIKVANTIGKLTLALRSPHDSRPAAALSVNQNDLLRNSPSDQAIVGRAVGPDGRLYKLGENGAWSQD